MKQPHIQSDPWSDNPYTEYDVYVKLILFGGGVELSTGGKPVHTENRFLLLLWHGIVWTCTTFGMWCGGKAFERDVSHCCTTTHTCRGAAVHGSEAGAHECDSTEELLAKIRSYIYCLEIFWFEISVRQVANNYLKHCCSHCFLQWMLDTQSGLEKNTVKYWKVKNWENGTVFKNVEIYSFGQH